MNSFHRERVIALLLLGVQLSALAFTSRTVAFPAVIAAAAVVAVMTGWRLSFSRQSWSQIYLVLAVAFAAKYLLFPHEFPAGIRFIGSDVGHAIAQFFLVVQLLEFYRRRPSGRMSPALPVWASAAMICTFNVTLPSIREREIHQLLALGFVLCCALYLGVRRRWITEGVPRRSFARRAIGETVLLLACILAWGTSEALFRFERDIEELLSEFVDSSGRNTSIGFSERSRLGSVVHQKRTAEDQIALQISGDSFPGYLRGKVFDQFQYNEWRATAVSSTRLPMSNPPERFGHVRADDGIFALRPAEPGEFEKRLIWPDASLAGRAFLPLESTHLKAEATQIVVDKYSIAEIDDVPPGHPYTAYIDDRPVRDDLPELTWERLRSPSPPRDPRVEQLAARLFAGLTTDAEKIEAVTGYFHAHYQYSLHVLPPTDGDPLTWFLLDRPAAHCEYFATGAATLLRLGGVACRYVTGFVPTEQNRYGDYWLARNKDAHAWVEAYDRERGWVIVEATPSSGVPERTAASEPKQLWEYARDRTKRLRVYLQRGELQEMLVAAIRALATAPGVLVIAIIAALLGGVWWLRRRKSAPQVDPRHAEMQRLLARMDARLRRRRIQRNGHETLTQFAERIRNVDGENADLARAAEWYRGYVSARYSKEATRDHIEQLSRMA